MVRKRSKRVIASQERRAIREAMQPVEAERLDPMTLFNLLAPIAQNPGHFIELWDRFAPTGARTNGRQA